jgi:hypothetical protein
MVSMPFLVTMLLLMFLAVDVIVMSMPLLVTMALLASLLLSLMLLV